MVTVYYCAFLPNWPEGRNALKQKTISILIQSSETISPNAEAITASTVNVGYYRTGSSPLKPLLELHYDYESNPQDGHPLFHAQYGRTDWPEKPLQDFEITLDQASIPKLLGRARIPTPHMGLAATLLSIAADHFEPPFFDSFLSEYTQFADFFRPNINHHLTSSPNNCPLLHHWYEQ